MAGEKGVFVVNLTNEHRKKWAIAAQGDVLVLKNICDPDFLPLIKARKDQGKVTIYEIADDLSAIEPWNPVHFFYRDMENQSLAWRLASYCDALQVTCPRLKELYGHLNSTCRVFPNQISHLPEERSCRQSEGLIIGWGGSHGHLQDMAEISDSLSRWIMSERNTSLCLMASEPIHRLFEKLPRKKKKYFQTGSIEKYYSFLRHIDVGIGPLKDTPFNRSRSDVKFLEYAVSGIVPVMKKLAPYTGSVVHGKTGLLYTDPQDLAANLSLLSRDPVLLESLAKSARKYVLQHRIEADHAQERVEFYRDLLQRENGVNSGPALQELVNTWASMEGAVMTGRHIKLEHTEFEALLHKGLLAMQIREDRETAFRLFRSAAAMEPDNYLPYLYESPISPNPAESLQKAIKLNPFSLKGRILLGELLHRNGRALEALRCFGGAAEIFSEYEIPYRRAASVLDRIGECDQAAHLSKRAASLSLQGACSEPHPENPPAAELH
jgi:glycosyltransferase involved in cell wall biosynthesis